MHLKEVVVQIQKIQINVGFKFSFWSGSYCSWYCDNFNLKVDSDKTHSSLVQLRWRLKICKIQRNI